MPDSAPNYAILTDPGPAAISVIRVWGDCRSFLLNHVQLRSNADLTLLPPGIIRRAALLDQDRSPIDDILVCVVRGAPHWDVHLNLHGSRWIVQRCAELLDQSGFRRLDDPFAATAGLWPAANLVEQEAFALLPRMTTLAGAHWLLYQARALPAAIERIVASGDSAKQHAQTLVAEILGRRRIIDYFANPLRVAIVGPPNAGKSTLINAITDHAASIVSAIPGTTRDWVEARGEIHGFPAVWIDTAGLRATDDPLEAAGIEGTLRASASADIAVLVLDGDPAARARQLEFIAGARIPQPACAAINKSDLHDDPNTLMAAVGAKWPIPIVRISAQQTTGLDRLLDAVCDRAGSANLAIDQPAAFTDQQASTLLQFHNSLDYSVLSTMVEPSPPQFPLPVQ